jgi:dihydroflavonol-4-reductase
MPADELTPVKPDTPYASTKLEAEKLVSMHPEHVILRIGPIYGPGFKEYFRVLRMIKKKKMPVIGSGKNLIPFVHVSDVALAIKNAVEEGSGLYVLVGECLSQDEVYGIAAKEFGVDAPKKHVPVAIAKVFAHFELLRTSFFGGRAMFIPEDIAVLSSNRAFNCKKAIQELGFSPRPLEYGIREMVAMCIAIKSLTESA